MNVCFGSDGDAVSVAVRNVSVPATDPLCTVNVATPFTAVAETAVAATTTVPFDPSTPAVALLLLDNVIVSLEFATVFPFASTTSTVTDVFVEPLATTVDGAFIFSAEATP